MEGTQDQGRDYKRVLSFKIPSLPPSMNSIYNVFFHMKRVELKPEVRLFKTNAKAFIPPFEIEKKDKLALYMAVHADWYFRNGKFKKIDVSNMVKVVQDLICEKLGCDDAQVWETRACKVQDKKNVVHIRLEVMNE